jgi:2-keto-4-pentenoate hydratase/2-oxohepta-3-ene-1,7-dioic acid hydratase in catechol pathway
MLFPVARLVAYISEFMTLLPGDVIATGTPDGVGRGRNPPRYLRAGETVEVEVEGLGRQRHKVVGQ